MATVALDCTICPKKPVFSDLSHLLTHLASKGHLSHYFKAQVKSQQDADVLAELQAFDKWYTDSQMGRLLHDRMAQKEKRRATTRAKHAATKGGNSTRQISAKPKMTSQRALMRNDPTQEMIDPRLTSLGGADSYNYFVDHANCSQSHALHRPFETNQRSDPEGHGLAGPGASQAPLAFMHSSLLDGYSSLYGSADCPNSSSGLHMPVPVGLLSPLPSNISLSRSTEDARVGSHEIHTSIESDPDPVVETSEYATLKGIIWPGMDLFDSASPHAKRIRNQKKDSSCLEQMRSYAETIEPNEDIYYFPSWKLKQSREITGQVESSSPEGKDPTPRAQRKKGRNKRARPGRVPLSNLDSNQFLMKRPTPKLPETACGTHKQAGFSSMVMPMPMPVPSANHSHGLKGIGGQWAPFLDDEFEWQMTYGTGRQTDGKTFVPIFRDPYSHGALRANVRRPSPHRQDDGDLINTPSHRPRPRAAGKISSMNNGISANTNNRSNRTNGTSFEQQLRAVSCVMGKVQEGQENRPPSLEPYISEFDNKNASMFSTFQPRKSYGNNDMPIPSDDMRRRLPFADYMGGYQNFSMPVMTPGKGDRKVENNPLSIFSGGKGQQSPAKIDQSPASINPLLDFSALFNPSKMHESDDETIDDGIGEDEN